MLSMSFNRSRSAVSWNQSNAKIHEDAKIHGFQGTHLAWGYLDLSFSAMFLARSAFLNATWPSKDLNVHVKMQENMPVFLNPACFPAAVIGACAPAAASLDFTWHVMKYGDIDLNEKINMTKISLSCLVPNTGWRSQCRRSCLIHENW